MTVNSCKFVNCLLFVSFVVSFVVSCEHSPALQQTGAAAPSGTLYYVSTNAFPGIGCPGCIYSYNLASRTVDSFPVPDIDINSGAELVALPDGSRLYYSAAPGGIPRVIDPITRSVVDTLAYSADEMTLSPDGKWLALSCPGSLAILATDSNRVVYRLTRDHVISGKFTDDNTEYTALYSKFGSSSTKLLILHIRTSDWAASLDSIRPIQYAERMIRIDSSHYCFYGRPTVSTAESNEIALFDRTLDSVTFRYHFSPGNGESLYDPIGHVMYFTSPGNQQDILPPGSLKLHLISLQGGMVQVDSIPLLKQHPQTLFTPQHLSMLTGGSRLAISGLESTELLLFDCQGRVTDTALLANALLVAPAFAKQ